ncbi:MAG: hypothetical protein ACRD3D_00150 [Terriglobia bacterium]
MADQKVYTGVTPASLEALRSELKSMGITPPEGDSGTVTYQGVKLGMDYAPAAQTLTVQILDKPIFIPESLIWQLLDARIQKSVGT